MQIPTLLLAAGLSSRMRGADKLMQNVNGAPCLREMVLRATATGQSVFVTVPSLSHPRVQCLTDLDVQLVPVPDAPLGMSRSLQTGVSALPSDVDAVQILPADMPDVQSDDLAQMQKRFAQTEGLEILQATTEDGTFGHPIVFAKILFEQFARLSGDKGAAPLIARDKGTYQTYRLAGQRARLDLDTPEAWAAWRAAQAKVS